MPRYKITEPILKLVATKSIFSRVLDPDDVEGIETAKKEFDRIEYVKFWLECDDSVVEGHCLYTLNSDPKRFSDGNGGFFDMDEAIDYFEHQIS